ncbi:MAG: hypothetical protein JWO20_2375 [Candidatus Angelobacter sp.]|jgi:hypothetical protein|nr:hypothetical protein [Candidatus Angelobacter sp.]
MRIASQVAVMFVLGGLSLAQQPPAPAAAKAENPAIVKIDAMKANAEKKSSADRARAYADIARELVEVANQQFTDGEVDKAQSSIKDAVAYSEKSAAAAQEKGKKIKNTEITLRETARRIDEIRRTVAADDQPPLAVAVTRIEELRRELLAHMFGNEKK